MSRFSDLLVHYEIKEKGKSIFNQGQPVSGVYFVCKGLVKLSKMPKKAEGEEAIVDFFGPCSLVDGIALEEGLTRACTAATVGGLTEIGYVSKSQFLTFMKAHPAVAINLAAHLSEKLTKAYKAIGRMILPVLPRAVHLLSQICRFRRTERGRTLVTIPFSNRELAEIIQTTPETLSRTFSSLRAKGILHKEREGSWLIKKEAMEKYVKKSEGD